MELFDRSIWNEKAPENLGKDNCPLCNRKIEREYILWEWKHWYIKHNIFPYLGIKKHVMAIPIEHITVSSDISKDAYSEMSEVQKFIKNFFWKEDYFSFTRETFANRSLEHLHIHFLPGRIQGKSVREMLKNQGF